jgi:hypothetical protein
MPFGHDVVAEAGCIGIFAILINTLYLKNRSYDIYPPVACATLTSQMVADCVCHAALMDQRHMSSSPAGASVNRGCNAPMVGSNVHSLKIKVTSFNKIQK